MVRHKRSFILLSAAFISLGSVVGEAKALVAFHDPFRYFQHQATDPADPDNPFMGFCYSAAGYNSLLGIVDSGNGSWIAAAGGSEAYGTSFAGLYNGANGHNQYNDGDVVNELSSWVMLNENFVTTFLTPPSGFVYKTFDYNLANLGQINLASAIGAMALVDRVDIPDKDFELAPEWWGNFHVVSLYEMDIANRTVKFTDSNIDKTGKEYTGKPGAKWRQDFTYGILEGGGQVLSWNNGGIIQNADGSNMDDELLVSIRVISKVPVSVPAPLPVLGILAALKHTKDLRRMSKKIAQKNLTKRIAYTSLLTNHCLGS